MVAKSIKVLRLVFDASLDHCKSHVVKDLERLCVKIKERLEWSDVQLLRALLAY